MIVTLAELKTRLGIVTGDDDAFLDEQNAVVQEAVENYCGRKFEVAAYTQTYYKDDFDLRDMGYAELMAYHFPLTVITSIKEVNRDSDGVPTEDALVAGDYRAHMSSGGLKRTEAYGVKTSWFRSHTEVEFSYSAGYAVADMPQTIRDVIFNLVTERYNKSKAGVDLAFGSDVQRVSIPGVMSIDYDYSLQANERKSAFGMILGNFANVLDHWRSERALLGPIRDSYV